MSPADVTHFFRVENLTVLFVASEPELPKLFSALVHCQLVPRLQPARLDILVQVGANAQLNVPATSFDQRGYW